MRSGWVCAALVASACGGGGGASGGSTDASGADVAIDSAPVTGTIHVTLIGGMEESPQPLVGESVIFTDLLQTQVLTSDANGQVSATVTGPTSVIQLHYVQTTLEARVIREAQPGDDLLLRWLFADYTAHAPLTVNFTPPATPYKLCSACSCTDSPTSPATLPMAGSCDASPLVVTLLAFSNGTTVSYATGTATYDRATGGTLNLPALTPVRQYTSTFTNAGPPLTSLTFDFNAGGQSRQTFYSPSGTLNASVPIWDGPHARMVTTYLNTNGAGEYQFSIHAPQPGVTAESTDVAASLLPWLGTPTVDLATRHITVPVVAAGGADGDMFAMNFGYQRTNGSIIYWTVFGPSATDFQLPEIPAAVEDSMPTSTTNSIPATSYVLASDAIAGYAEARRDPYKVFHGSRTPGALFRLSGSPNAQEP